MIHWSELQERKGLQKPIIKITPNKNVYIKKNDNNNIFMDEVGECI